MTRPLDAPGDSGAVTVSVVIPAYNASGVIGQALGSVEHQTYPIHEVIVVDDGSADAGELAALIRRRFPWARLVSQPPPNRGPAAARNRGISEARGELVAFLDADDAWHPLKTEVQVACFRKYPDLGLVSCRTLKVRTSGQLGGVGLGEPYAAFGETPRKIPLRWFNLPQLLWRNRISQSGIIVRRSLLERLTPPGCPGPYDESLGKAEDYDLWLRACLLARVAVVQMRLAVYRLGGASLSSDVLALVEAEEEMLRRKHWLVCRQTGIDPELLQRLRYLRRAAWRAAGRRPGWATFVRRALGPGGARVAVSPPGAAPPPKPAPAGPSDAPLVSVVVPVYDSAGFIRRALESVRAQTYRNVEVIVVDDGSQDGTARVVAEEFPEAVPLSQPHRGVSAARNLAIQRSSGSLVAFLDADDEWLPEKLQAQVDWLARHPAAATVGTLAYSTAYRRSVLSYARWLWRRAWVRAASRLRAALPAVAALAPARPERWVTLRSLVVHNPFVTSSVVVRRSALSEAADEAGRVFADLRIPQDFDLWLRLVARFPAAVLQKPLVRYNWGPQSASYAPDAGPDGEMEALFGTRKLLLDQAGVPLARLRRGVHLRRIVKYCLRRDWRRVCVYARALVGLELDPAADSRARPPYLRHSEGKGNGP